MMRGAHYRLLVTLLLAGCGRGTAVPSAPAQAPLKLAEAPCAPGLAAFKTTVFPFIREHCALCHDGTGRAPEEPGPSFAVADPVQSYAGVHDWIDFTDLGESEFVEHGGNHHCLSHKGPPDCGADRDQVLAVAQAWWTQGENQCVGLGKYVTAPLVLPATLPTVDKGFQTLRFDLSSLGPSYAGVLFEVEAQHFQLPSPATKGAYRFRQPRLATSTKPLAFAGIRLAINGANDPKANEWSGTSGTIIPGTVPADTATPLPFPSLSPFTMILIQDKASGDTLKVGFDQLITAGTAPQCKALDKFQGVLDAMADRDCYACHGGGPDNEAGTARARGRFPMTGTAAELCAQALERVDPSNVQASVFVSYPLRGSNDHPHVFTEASEIEPAFEAWVGAEEQ